MRLLYAKPVASPEVEYEKEYFTGIAYSPYQDFKEHRTRVDNIISIANPKSVLDVGCAYGYIVRRLLLKGIDAWGIDISKWCEKQSEGIISKRFLRHDIREIPWPFKDNRFDTLYCEGVLEHIEEEHIPHIFKEMERVSQNRILAITFGTKATHGHFCNHDMDWWLKKVPRNTWLYCGEASSDVQPFRIMPQFWKLKGDK